jgi:GT2 family glycosyltransferase
MITIIIVNHNGRDHTRACLQSLHAVSPKIEYEIILVDNDSADGTVEIIRKEFPEVMVLPQKSNGGFGWANNIGATEAKGEYLLFLNNDTIFTMDILTPLADFLHTHDSIGVVAPMLLNPDGSYQLSYGKFPSIMNELGTKKDTAFIKHIPKDRSPQQVDWVSFAAVMIRKSAFETVQGFDARYFMYFEDADLCYRLKKAGYHSFYYPECILLHEGGGSWSHEVTSKIKIEYRRSQILFYLLHRSWYESFALRVYLILRFIFYTISFRVDRRRQAYSIIKMAIAFHANRT